MKSNFWSYNFVGQLAAVLRTAQLTVHQKGWVHIPLNEVVARELRLERRLLAVKVRCVTSYTTPEYNGGPSWIRTRELRRDQIYSLAVLTTHPKTHMNCAVSHDNNWNVTNSAVQIQRKKVVGGRGGTWTLMSVTSQDFKSCASACSATCPYSIITIPNLHTTQYYSLWGHYGFAHWCTRKESNFQTLVSKTSCFANLHTRAYKLRVVRYPQTL